MNSTFLTWMIVAAVAALGLFLFLGLAGADPAAQESTDLVVGDESSDAYWEPVVATSYSVPMAVGVSGAAAPCPSCTAQQFQPVVPVVVAPVSLAGGCGQPASACAATPCRPLGCSSGCPTDLTCGQPVCGERPRINRNMPLCVDECGFLQLHTTIPQPTCREIRFEWAATKGSFLNPFAPDPIYYAPTSYFPSGEDVWITVSVTDAQGIRFTDQVQVHVNDVR
jgi:hypothetical protein